MQGPDRRRISAVTGTGWARAHINAISSRAMATTTWLACLPRASGRRKRLHSRTCAFQLVSWIGLGSCARRSCRCRLTLAGSREAQAPSTRARRAGVVPVFGRPPWWRRAPREDADGVRPRAQQPRQWDRVPTVGVPAVTGLWGPAGGRDDPADLALVRQIARAPVSPGSCVIDEDQVGGLCLPRAHALSHVAWPRAHGPQGDDRRVVCVGDLGHGDGVLVDIQPTIAWARVRQG
jgi:hypothetical protein